MAENGLFGTPFLTPKIPPKKFMWVPFLRSFPGNEAHKLFSGGPNWGVLGGGQKVYVEKVYMLFLSPNVCLSAHVAAFVKKSQKMSQHSLSTSDKFATTFCKT